MNATAPEYEGAERRAAPRMRVLKRAKLIFNNGFSTFDCIVRNISATGALLTIDDSVHLPKDFRIRIGEEPATRPAELIYRRSMFAGIRFLDIGEHGLSAPAVRTAPEQPPAAAAAQEPEGERRATIRRIVPERLPDALTSRFAWRRSPRAGA
ncbi:PilZ domain-containing protein [Jiella sonneratiae]|uniref:PilZ domain-containing protein n=1 Tax=Jiella sonneratiae TaxID=2816856 RepID=A0ABS3JB25_9HYPH|nr:PilZ domain-containing protein [Jiella sonneratiae]MBO0905801.1 PilZ domain-containing protein [Jiella sonneratiae]